MLGARRGLDAAGAIGTQPGDADEQDRDGGDLEVEVDHDVQQHPGQGGHHPGLQAGRLEHANRRPESDDQARRPALHGNLDVVVVRFPIPRDVRDL